MGSSTLGYTLATTLTREDAMTNLELITYELRRLHKALDKSLEGLTPEQLHQVPAGHPAANTIAWGLWHYARTEDNVIRYILQNRRPIVWVEGGYAEKLGLPPIAQGTGMTTQEAQALRIKDLARFRDYVARVWASTDEYLARVDAAALDALVTIKPLGEMPAVRALAEVCVTHGFTHFGEIELARTLVGAKPVSGG
jgi:DinB superfamily